MYTSPEVKRDILIALIIAEKVGKPINLSKALNKWGCGSAWESLVDSGYISRLPEAVTATNFGKNWLFSSFPASDMFIESSVILVEESNTNKNKARLYIFLAVLISLGILVLEFF